MAKELKVCQYWVIDEPVECKWWNEEEQKCGFEPTKAEAAATYAPDCNRIGTAIQCNQYSGTGDKARCVLPDTFRHVVNRKTGKRWLIEQISGYNDGECDGKGTGTAAEEETTCSGYSPYHMAFSKLQPRTTTGEVDDEKKDILFDEGMMATIDDLGYRLPLNYEVYNKRAQLSRCYWWKAEIEEFGVGDDGKIEEVITKCTATHDEKIEEFWEFTWDKDLNMVRAPCNGTKPECPGYTGICWQYCVDEKMRQGDKVLAEQILELRYYIRKDAWNADEYQEAFKDPSIKAWTGSKGIKFDPDDNNKWTIEAVDTYFDSMSTFAIEHKKLSLIAGMPANDYVGDYPTLVRELKGLPLRPIIRNEFDNTGFYVDSSGRIYPKNIFEVIKLKHKDIKIFGDIFYYGSQTYGINLSDPDLKFLPAQLKEYHSMADIEIALKNGFDDFYQDLEDKLDQLIKYLPEKTAVSEISGENSFYMNVETFFGDNEIVVFDKGSGAWEYDRISVKKLLCNGVIGQTSFSVEGSGGLINYLPAYENDFASYANRNGLITFGFFPFSSADGRASVDYVYNDSVRKRLDYNPARPAEFDTYEISYKLFKILVFDELELEPENFKIFGNAGHALVMLPDDDKVLSNVVKPWEAEGDIILSTTDGDIEMEIVDRDDNIDKLEVNQIIVKPKKLKSFKQPCDATIKIGPIYIYEKRSFGQEPDSDYEEIRESFVDEDDVVVYDKNLELTQVRNTFELRRFGYQSLMMSAVFKGSSGRIKGQTKTKMITWVRQPYCRDVEIRYSWSAMYSHQTLLPEMELYGQTGVKVSIAPVIHSYMPRCGDHDATFFRGFVGPMWYPYEECDSAARYNITGALTEWDISIMEIFSLEPHGSWDLRMLGPADSIAYTCGSHAQLWDCTSDWTFCNDIKKSANMFIGTGRYRGALDAQAKFDCSFDGGALPKFGNPFRDFLRSYRSIDNIDYYYFTGQQFARRRKWVPTSEFYTTADITADIEDYPFHSYSSNDYYNDHASFVHPMGLMLVDSSIEGVMINEQISSLLWRYRFDEIFKTHSTMAGIYYPMPKKLYLKKVGGVPTPIVSWYTYKDYPPEPGPGGPWSIQWVWQEPWREIERYTWDLGSLRMLGTLQEICIPVGPYKFVCDAGSCEDLCLGHLEGRHAFLEVEYPDYKYDAEIAEHRLVCDEDDYTLYLMPPTYEGGDVFFWLKLGDSGPRRAFDVVTGAWDPPGSEEIYPDEYELYTTCTTDPWVTDVTLFAPGYNDPSEEIAEDDGRMILTYDDLGEEVKKYYQRGLNITIGSLDSMPALQQRELEGWEIMFGDKADCMEEDSNIFWANIDVDEWYEAEPCLEVKYCCGGVGAETYIEIEYNYKGNIENGAISKIDCQFGFGAKELEPEEGEEQVSLPGNVWFGDLYHIPGVEIFTSSDGINYSPVYESEAMILATRDDGIESETKSYSWTTAFSEMEDSLGYVKLKFRIAPTQNEIDEKSGLSGYYSFCANMIWIECINIYYTSVIEAEEDITTWERKYHISFGEHGDFPPHGYDSTGSLLYVMPTDRSTVYQVDTPYGVTGMPNSAGNHKIMNKCRGRIMFECHEDKERLDVSGGGGGIGWLSAAEGDQKKIHDEIAGAGVTSFTMVSTIPPGLEEYLDKAGVIFPSWSCEFKNTLILQLSPVIPRSSFSPCGHEFFHDYSNAKHKICGRLFGRTPQEVFEYAYRNACVEGVYWTSMDAITAYLRGVGSFLVNSMNYLSADMSRADQIQEQLRSVTTQAILQQKIEDKMQDPVDSF